MLDETRERVRRYYDRLGDGEWQRLAATVRGRVSFEVHRLLLSEFIRRGDRVLEIGAGAGRFTIALAEQGATIVVSDISDVQLDLNRAHVREAGHESAVESRCIVDVRDTSRFTAGEFDAVVAFGGPLSYAFESANDALDGLLRVGKVVVASVMSTLGTWRFFLPQIIDQAALIGQDATDRIVDTGDLRHSGPETPHVCQMFRSAELAEMVRSCRAELLAISASNWASMADETTLARLANDPDQWRRFMQREISACRQPGTLDGGTHILFAAQAIGHPQSRSREQDGSA